MAVFKIKERQGFLLADKERRWIMKNYNIVDGRLVLIEGVKKKKWFWRWTDRRWIPVFLTKKRKWFWIFVFLLLLLQIPLADFLALPEEQGEMLLQMSVETFFAENPKCAEAEISIMTDGVELLIEGSCVKYRNDTEI